MANDSSLLKEKASKVLIIDDEEINREILANIIKDECECLFAKDGDEGLAILKQEAEEIDLVLLDLIMPKMDGITFLKFKKENPEISEIPVIVLTSDKEKEVECLKLGAMDFIKKPFESSDVILARIMRIIEHYRVNHITKKMDEVALEIDDVYKSYGKKEVLKGISLYVKKGEIYGFVGKNGVGKSTTIDAIVGLKDFNSGDIKIFGQSIKDDPVATKKLFGYVPSEPTAYELMTGKEFLEFIGSSYGMIQSSFDANYDFLKRKFDLPEADLNRKISEYSHGMKQKVCLMASLIHNPKLWVLDEPTVGLDIMVYEVLLRMLRDYAKAGNTIFITSHNIELVSAICDKVAIVNEGKIAVELDFKKEPYKRKDLKRVFFKVYGEGVENL